MVLTEISQFTKECSGWRESLHSYRDELHNMQSSLQRAITHQLSKEEQTELEHFQNQLHIQLINVHDLKRAVKMHDRQLHSGDSSADFHYSDNILAYHENLNDNYQLLSHTLSELRSDLDNFMHIIQ